MAERNYQKMFEEAQEVKEEFFAEHREVLEKYKALARQCGYAKHGLEIARRAKRQEIIQYILKHDGEFTSSELYQLCGCENCYHSPGSLSNAVEFEWVQSQYHKKIDRCRRTITRKYVEVDDSDHIIPGSTLSRTTEVYAYRVRREE